MRSITQRSYGLHPGGIISLPATAYATIYPLLQGLYNKAEYIWRYTFQNFFTLNNRGFFSATGQFFQVVLAHKPVFTTMFRAVNHFPNIPCNSGKISVVSCRQLIHKQVSHSIDRIGIPNLENILHFPVNSGKEISRPLKVIGIGSVGYFVGRVVGHKVYNLCLNMQYPYTNTAVTSSFSVYNFHRKVKQGLNHPDRQVITRGQFPKRTQFWEIKKHPVRDASKFVANTFNVGASSHTGFPSVLLIPSTASGIRHYLAGRNQNSYTYFKGLHHTEHLNPFKPITYFGWVPPKCFKSFHRKRHYKYKQFLNYQGVVVKFSVVKSVVKPSEISLFSNVFTGGLSDNGDSPQLHLIQKSPVYSGLLSFNKPKP